MPIMALRNFPFHVAHSSFYPSTKSPESNMLRNDQVLESRVGISLASWTARTLNRVFRWPDIEMYHLSVPGC